MRKSIAIVTSLAIFLASTGTTEWVKVPHLLAHFVEHVAQDGGSFASFLKDHYEHTAQSHQDKHHDKGCLPFQGDHCPVHVSSLAVSDKPAGGVEVPKPCTDVHAMATAYLRHPPASPLLAGVFQPPRLG